MEMGIEWMNNSIPTTSVDKIAKEKVLTNVLEQSFWQYDG